MSDGNSRKRGVLNGKTWLAVIGIAATLAGVYLGWWGGTRSELRAEGEQRQIVASVLTRVTSVEGRVERLQSSEATHTEAIDTIKKDLGEIKGDVKKILARVPVPQ